MRDFRVEDFPFAEKWLNAGRIVHASMCAFLLLFGGVALLVVGGDPPKFGSFHFISYLSAGYSIFSLFASTIVPNFIATSQRKAISDVSDTESFVRLFQNKSLIGWALLEGPGLFVICGYLIDKQAWVLGFALVLLLLLIVRAPTKTQMEYFVAQQMELADLERDQGK